MMSLLADQFVIIAIASVVAAACALVGVFLLLQRKAMLGDAISHAALPGIVIAFLLSGGQRSSWVMLLGAAAFAVVTVLLVGALERSRLVGGDAALGVVFSILFAVGVILVTRFTGQVHLDVDCVLYGELAYAPLDVVQLAGITLGPRALYFALFALLVNLALVGFCFRQLEVSSFDPVLALSLGLSPLLLHYVLMSAVSVTVVASFEAVGAILVVAMLVVPPATAYLLTDRLRLMVVLAMGLGVLSAAVGVPLAMSLDLAIAGTIAATAGCLFLLGLVFSPRYGLVRASLAQLRFKRSLEDRVLLRVMGRGIHDESQIAELLGWRPARLKRVLARLEASSRPGSLGDEAQQVG